MLSYEDFCEALRPYEIEGGFGSTIETGNELYYVPNDNPLLGRKFSSNKKTAYKEYKKLFKLINS